MKKMLKVAAVIAVASLAFVACKNNKPAEEPIDSTQIEMVVEDSMAIDSIVDTTVVAEEVTPAPAKKATAKKAEPKTQEAGTVEVNPAKKEQKVTIETAKPEDIEKTNTVKREGRR